MKQEIQNDKQREAVKAIEKACHKDYDSALVVDYEIVEEKLMVLKFSKSPTAINALVNELLKKNWVITGVRNDETELFIRNKERVL